MRPWPFQDLYYVVLPANGMETVREDGRCVDDALLLREIPALALKVWSEIGPVQVAKPVFMTLSHLEYGVDLDRFGLKSQY